MSDFICIGYLFLHRKNDARVCGPLGIRELMCLRIQASTRLRGSFLMIQPTFIEIFLGSGIHSQATPTRLKLLFRNKIRLLQNNGESLN